MQKEAGKLWEYWDCGFRRKSSYRWFCSNSVRQETECDKAEMRERPHMQHEWVCDGECSREGGLYLEGLTCIKTQVRGQYVLISKVFNFILALSIFCTPVQCGRWPNYYFNYYFARQGRQKIFLILLRHKYKSEKKKKKSHQWQLELQCLGNCERKAQDHPFEIRCV